MFFLIITLTSLFHKLNQFRIELVIQIMYKRLLDHTNKMQQLTVELQASLGHLEECKLTILTDNLIMILKKMILQRMNKKVQGILLKQLA